MGGYCRISRPQQLYRANGHLRARREWTIALVYPISAEPPANDDLRRTDPVRTLQKRQLRRLERFQMPGRMPFAFPTVNLHHAVNPEIAVKTRATMELHIFFF